MKRLINLALILLAIVFAGCGGRAEGEEAGQVEQAAVCSQGAAPIRLDFQKALIHPTNHAANPAT